MLWSVGLGGQLYVTCEDNRLGFRLEQLDFRVVSFWGAVGKSRGREDLDTKGPSTC